ncbi:MAG: glycosyltransferase family 2 protein [Firmicutes bacterium]|nr:glycosyltransferase family 2 protein [Bacillota bacterium]MCM1401230.1 glycosyltransferase family 2 protein [Bacteroides sp.]MCM1477221.1 glycosyltransferase family 2 protein [Bacteroides sp.]
MMPAQPYIAVIMPAYNAEKTVGAAIDSVLGQDFKDFILIVINDCSTDSTGSIIDERLKNHSNAYVYHKPMREGYACALIDGFRGGPAVYVMCCDADDTMRPGALSALAQEATKTNADIVFAPYVQHVGDKTKLVTPKADIRSLNDMPIDTAHFALWNKLIKTYVLDESAKPFPGLDRWADLAIVAKLMTQVRKIAQISTPVYNYFERPGVVTLARSSKEKLLSDHIAIAVKLVDWFNEQGYSDKYNEFLDHLMFCAKIKYARAPHRDLRKWHETFPQVNSRIMQLRHIPLAYRMLFQAAHLSQRILGR